MKKHNLCILGSGLVSSSVINFFCRNPCDVYTITVGSIISNELEQLQKQYPRIATVVLDVTKDKDMLSKIIKASDIVISLLTNEMQVPIAKMCIALKVNMVHASYCTKEMLELDSDARCNGVTILNELGLDPGIDHFLAMKVIDELRMEGATITGFLSYCGGLPEPKASHDNPLRYKFSWSPVTSLKNLLNPANYLLGNKVIEVPAGGSLINAIEISSDNFPGDIGQLEAYPNRDSLVYKDLYGIQEADTVIRGTYRYKGFKETVQVLFRLGLLNQQSTTTIQNNEAIKSWGDLIEYLICNEGEPCSSLHVSLQDKLIQHGYTLAEIKKMDELGLLSKHLDLKLKATLLETLADYLSDKLEYKDGERDVVIMRHEVRYEKCNTDEKSSKGTREILFVAYGEQDQGGFSAMSKTVGLTVGHAAKMLLNGSLKRTGVIYPFTADIYLPLLEKLNQEGLLFTECEK